MSDYKKQTRESALVGEQYTKYTHPEGLEIYILKKDTSTAFALLGTKYGSLHNSFYTPDGRLVRVPEGIAHFLEHKLFCCEDGSDAFERFSALGADANAYTSFNCTAYHFSCSENFYESLGELVDFVTHPYFTEDSVKKEVPIITEEIAMCDDNPYNRCFYGMLEGMYRTHAIRDNICGTAESIKKISAEQLYMCYEHFYRPDNMLLVVCGDVDEVQVLSTVDAHLPDTFKRGAEGRRVASAQEPREVYRAYTEQSMPTAKPLFTLGFKHTDIPDSLFERNKKSAETGILCEMLFSTTGKLYEELFESRMISPSFSYEHNTAEGFSYTALSGEADNPREVLAKIEEYLDRVAAEGLAREAFERARRVIYSSFVRAFDSSESIGHEVFSFAVDGIDIFRDIELIGNVTYEDTVRRFEEFYKTKQITLSVVKPIN